MPVFLLNDLFALPDLAYISGSFDPADPLVHSYVLDIVGDGVDTKENDLDKGREKRLSLAESANFRLMVSTQIQPG